MGSEILKFKLFLLAWFHLKSRPSSVYFVKCFSYKDIKKATDRFRRIQDSNSSGATYKAKFQNGYVAMVKENRMFQNLDDDAFCRKVELLGRLHHRHIVPLCGFSTGNKRFLVYEHLERGSLKDHLSDPLKTPLNWRTRLQIAVGIAAALEYLHFFCDPPVYHVSISSSTVMLDENLSPKLCDVGLLSSAGSEKTLPSSSENGLWSERWLLLAKIPEDWFLQDVPVFERGMVQANLKFSWGPAHNSLLGQISRSGWRWKVSLYMQSPRPIRKEGGS